MDLDPVGTTASEWSVEEQLKLDDALNNKYPAERYSAFERYILSAATLPNRTARDVALRVKWNALQELKNKRKSVDDPTTVGNRKKVLPVKPPSGVRSSGQPSTSSLLAAGGADASAPGQRISSVALANLLEQNYALLNQFKSNMSQFKVIENTDLLVRFRDNLVSVVQSLNNSSIINMPQLPVQMNLELANKFLPKPGATPPPFPSQMPMEFFANAPPGLLPGMQGFPSGPPGSMMPPSSKTTCANLPAARTGL